MSTPDDRSERQRLVDHLQDRHGPGLDKHDGATLDLLTQMHDLLHNSRDGAGTWPGGSKGSNQKDDLTSWDETKRLRTHLTRTHHGIELSDTESLVQLRNLRDQVQDESYRQRSPERFDHHRDHDRSDLTCELRAGVGSTRSDDFSR
jgi:hypothetical protein